MLRPCLRPIASATQRASDVLLSGHPARLAGRNSALGTLGGGGSILTVPALVYLIGENPQHATTASLVIVGVTAVTGTAGHARAGRVRWGAGLVFGIVGAGGSLLGSALNQLVNPDILLLAFAGLMVLTAAAMLQRARRHRVCQPARIPRGGTRPQRQAESRSRRRWDGRRLHDGFLRSGGRIRRGPGHGARARLRNAGSGRHRPPGHRVEHHHGACGARRHRRGRLGSRRAIRNICDGGIAVRLPCCGADSGDAAGSSFRGPVGVASDLRGKPERCRAGLQGRHARPATIVR